ncbi:MAG: M48 family peptidase, partial [Nitrospirota bacterium]|nr:M48 family peptidase [Nitrospirota bacterium]
MNGEQIILLISFILIAVFGYWLKFLNLRHLKKYGDVVPEEFKDYIDAQLLKKTRDYTLEQSRFGFIESIFGNILVLVFFFGGLLNMYNSWVVSFNMPFVLSGVAFFLVLSYA